MKLASFILMLGLLIPQAQPPISPKVNILLVSPPGETWTPAEQARAVGAVRDATAWWSRNSTMPVPSFELGWTAIITPTDMSYSVFTWEQAYYNYPPEALTVIVIDNSESHKTMGGAYGWAQDPCQIITALSIGMGDSQDALAAVIAHEYGHAVLKLGHAPAGADDIMNPAMSLSTYLTNTVGFYTRLAMGETFKKMYVPLAQK